MGIPEAPPTQRKRKKNRTAWIVGVAATVATVAGLGVCFAKSSKNHSASAAETKKSYSPLAEPAIPKSAGSGQVDPKVLSKGAGSAVKPSDKEIDLARDISYSPADDPYCKNPTPVVDVVKDAGFFLDQQVRSAESVTDEEEEKIGEEAFRDVKKDRKLRGKIDTPEMAADRQYIASIAVPLLAQVQRKGITYDFHTIDGDEPNAFAIPGGHIFVFKGMLEQPNRIQNEAQLVGVLAHEINHVDRRHTIAVFEYLRRLGGNGDRLGGMGEAAIDMMRHPFTSKEEEEADRYAVRFMMAAEYSPKQFVEMWQTWDKLDKEHGDRGGGGGLFGQLGEILDSHPRSSVRACRAMKIAMDERDPTVERYYVGTTNWKQRKPRSIQQF